MGSRVGWGVTFAVLTGQLGNITHPTVLLATEKAGPTIVLPVSLYFKMLFVYPATVSTMQY